MYIYPCSHRYIIYTYVYINIYIDSPSRAATPPFSLSREKQLRHQTTVATQRRRRRRRRRHLSRKGIVLFRPRSRHSSSPFLLRPDCHSRQFTPVSTLSLSLFGFPLSPPIPSPPPPPHLSLHPTDNAIA